MAQGLYLKYFILKPKGDDAYAIASRRALHMYANSINAENPELARDLLAWVKDETDASLERRSVTVDF